jgi:hypothetical protein
MRVTADEYAEIARSLGMPDDTCFVDMEQGCHAGEDGHDHNCACLNCIRSGAAFAEEE